MATYQLRVTYYRPLRPEEIKWPYTQTPETKVQTYPVDELNVGTSLRAPNGFLIGEVLIQRVSDG